MAKQLNIDMNIRANTKSAQAEIKKLQQSLEDAIFSATNSSNNLPLTKEISEAIQATAKLKVALESALNPQTGNLDLSKFSEQLSKSKTSLKDYSKQLLNLGPTGEKAFLQMANAIASAEVPLKRTSGLLFNLWTTMKNTARWQLSSSAIKGFTGAIAGAYGYAQDLNKSLNNIRVVTGQTTEDMARFAAEANKSAQLLSTTTTAYTDAALIYYQQGLSDEAVKKRTETTIKLANVSRQSAEEVSSQMTAIWNNFAEGSSNLEYYADVITALGASTASSSEEIAQGLSKFAAVADTVGLSYEKASAALATVVAETRQSADVVGTAFKTLFARMEGLSLGETLEDGTDLNKYSKALETIGVNIKDQSGELKSMDTILDNIGNKWQTLSKDQQIALAQTVAGVRQYTQFVALMDNYDKVQKNEDIAKDSKGTIQKQADTYAESWEASSKRVKAAAQGLYNDLLNDEFFIHLNDLLTGLINGVDKFVKTLGGIPGVLGLLGTIATTVFKDQIALSIDNLVYRLSVFTGVAQDSAKRMQEEIVQAVNGVANEADLSRVQKMENEVLTESLKLNQELSDKKDKLLETDYAHLQTLKDITKEYGEQAIAATKAAEEADEKQGKAKQNFSDKFVNTRLNESEIEDKNNPGQKLSTDEIANNMAIDRDTANDITKEIEQVITSAEAGKAAVDALNQALNGDGIDQNTYDQVAMNLEKIEEVGAEVPDYLQELNVAMKQQGEEAQRVQRISNTLAKEEKKLADMQAKAAKEGKKSSITEKDIQKQRRKTVVATKALEKQEKKLQKAKTKTGSVAKKTAKQTEQANKQQIKAADKAIAVAKRSTDITKEEIAAARQYANSVADTIKQDNKAIVAKQNYAKSVKDTKEAIKNASSEMMTSFGKGLTTTFQGVSQLTMGISSLKGMFDALNDTDMSFGEKFLSVASSLGMAIPSLISGFKNLKEGISFVKDGLLAGVKAFALHIGAMEADSAETKKASLADLASAINKKLKKTSTDEDTVSEGANTAAKGSSTIATVLQTIANWGLLASMPPLLAITLAFVAALIALAAIALIVVSVVNAITKANNADAEAAKNAEEAAENLAEAYNQCKEEYEKLKESISDHQSALEAIESLTKGTREWKDAIREANEKARELIESYHLIKDKDYTIDSDGIIRFNEGVEDRLVNEKADELAGKEAASIIAKQRAKKARAKSDLTDLKKREHADYNFGTFLEDVFTGGAIGKAQTISDIQSDKTINNAISRLTEGDLAEDFKLGNITSDELAEKLNIDDEDLIKSITDLATTINENTEAEKQSYQLAAEALVTENENVQKSEYKEELTNASGRIYEQYEKEAAEKTKSAIKDRGDFLWWNWSTDKAKEMMDKYAETAGLTDLKDYEVTNYSSDGELTYKYTDENGDTKEKTVKADEMASVLAEAEASEKLNEALEHMSATIQNLDINSSSHVGNQAAIDFLSNGDFSKSTRKEMNAVAADIEAAGSAEDYLDKIYGGSDGSLSDEEAKSFGYESADAMVEAFEEKQDEIKDEWKKITIPESSLSSIDDLSLEAAKNIQKNFDQISLGPAGEEAGQAYLDGLSKMTKDLNLEDQQAAMDELGKINWTDYDAIEQADAIMKKYGVDIDTTSGEWKEFADKMRIAAGAIPDFSKLKSTLNSISGILQKLDFGKVIDEKDYKQLIAYNDEWEKFFQLQADGTRIFIGDSADMTNELQNDIRAQREALQERQAVQEAFKNESWGHSEGEDDDEHWVLTDWKNKSGEDIDTAKNLLESTGGTEEMLKQLGYTDEVIQDMITKAESGQEDLVKEGTKELREMYRRIGEFQDEELEGQDKDFDEMLASTAQNLDELLDLQDEISSTAYDKQLSVLASKASSLEELQRIQQAAIDNSDSAEKGDKVGLDSYEYGQVLLKLAENYENCTNEAEEYNKALLSGDENQIKAAQSALELSIEIGELSKKYDLDAQTTENYAKRLAKGFENAGMSEEAAAKASVTAAIANQRLDRGINDLNDNLKDYKTKMASANKGTAEWSKTLDDLKTNLADILNMDISTLTDEFVEATLNSEDLELALDGDVEAVKRLQTAAAEKMIASIKLELDADKVETFTSQWDYLKANMEKAIKSPGVDQSALIASFNEMIKAGDMTREEIEAALAGLHVSANIKTTYNEQETEVPTTITEESVEDTGTTAKMTVPDENGHWTEQEIKLKRKITRTYPGKPTKVTGYVPTYEIEGTEGEGGATTAFVSTPTPSISYGSTSSAKADTSSDSSSDTKTTSAASHEHEVNRYSNEENAINGLSKEYEKLGKAKDQAFGKGRIYAMEQELKALKELKQASGDYLDTVAGKGNADKVAKAIYSGKNIGSMISSGELSGTIKSDYSSLYNGLSASGKGVEYTAKDDSGNEWLASDNYSLANFNSLFGTNLQFSLDSYGNLQNKDSILNLLQNLKNNENDAYSRAADPTASSTTEYNKRMAYLDEIKERIEQYGSTAELLTEKTDEYLDYISQLQEKNAELITEKMNNGVNLGQKTIQRLERSIKVLGDSIYKSAEAMQGWFDSTFKEGIQADRKQGDSAIQAIEETAQKVKLYEQNPLNENAISPAEAAEILSTAEDTLDGVIDSLLQRVQDGKEYYGNVLDYWNNKLDAVNRSIENNIKVFDHLQNILGLLGRSTDYEAIGDILQGKFKASQEDYLSKKVQANIAKQAYEQAQLDRKNLIAKGISDEALEAYDENILQKALDDYQAKADTMYNSLEQTIDLSNQLFENEMNKIMQESEDRLTDKWGNFSDLDSAMKRQQSISDEYLTKTNQIYETNSLLRKLSQDIDKNDSQIAKNKLKVFSDEITIMQTREKLSKTDLEIAKARYEVLKAQIALEEAQNAKSTVRLQRDNEGNYGYVYTADQEKTADAEQNLADKQNDLYNLLLTQAETYGQKSIEMRKEWQAEMQALVEQYQNDTSMSEEEFLMKQADINNKYREMEIAYQKSFQTANTWLNQVGAEGQTEAWINSFNEVITQHRIFNDDSTNKLNSYHAEVDSVADNLTNTINNKFKELKEQRDYFTKESKTGNRELQSSINEVTKSVSNLSKSVTQKGGLADSMSTAMKKAQDLSSAFIRQYDSLKALIEKYSTAANEANKLYIKTVDLINVQVALNHANNGATSVSWGSHGVTASYVNNNNNNNDNNDNGKDIINDSGNNKPTRKFNSISFSYDAASGRYWPYVNYTENGYTKNVKLPGSFGSADEVAVKNSTMFKNLRKSLGFKSGGYTGTWDGLNLEENGKLAFLHQKELVLNTEDTENILDAVKLIRQISQTIDLQAMAYNNSAFGLAAAHLASNNQTLQQEVTIHAEFPNATDHNEIEEAFNNLVNRASQYANRY